MCMALYKGLPHKSQMTDFFNNTFHKSLCQLTLMLNLDLLEHSSLHTYCNCKSCIYVFWYLVWILLPAVCLGVTFLLTISKSLSLIITYLSQKASSHLEFIVKNDVKLWRDAGSAFLVLSSMTSFLILIIRIILILILSTLDLWFHWACISLTIFTVI